MREMWSWLKMDDGCIILTFRYKNVSYPILQLENDEEFEKFFMNTTIFNEKLQIPEAFKNAFDINLN